MGEYEKKRVYSPIIVLGAVLFRTGRRGVGPYKMGWDGGRLTAAPAGAFHGRAIRESPLRVS